MALLDKLEIATDIGEEIDPDPVPDQPAPKRTRKARVPAPKPTRRAPQTVSAMAKEVGNDIATMLEMTSVVWGVRDQCCAPVLEKQAKPIGQALANILARNPDLLRKFAQAETGVFVMQCLALGQALLPVGQAVISNHVLKSGEVDGPNADVTDLESFPVFSGSRHAHPA
jgi:hypothetical protein